MSYLLARPDFRELVKTASRRKGIEILAIVEKNYYVTKALCWVAGSFQ